MNEAIQTREWRWVGAVSAVALLLAALPYLAGFIASSPDMTFGGSVINVEDYNTNVGNMQQGARGIWSYRLLHTSEPHQGSYYPPFYMLLGHISRWTGISLVAVYELARVFFGLVMLPTIYWFISLFDRRLPIRRTAFLLTVFSSGLGWLMLILIPSGANRLSPIDFWLTDAYTFFSLFTFPHFCLDISGVLWIMGCFVLYRQEWKSKYLIFMAAAALIVANIHALTLLVAGLTLVGYTGLAWIQERQIPWRLILAIGLTFTLPALLVIYLALSIRQNPILGGFMKQNITLSPPPLYFILGFGLILFLAIPGIIQAAQQRNPNNRLLMIWLAVVTLLLYAPFAMQRRVVVGVHVALSIFAAIGIIDWLLPHLRRSRLAQWLDLHLHYPPKRLAAFSTNLIFAICALSNAYLLAGLTIAAATRNPLLFHAGDQNAALEWLNENSSPDDTILAGFRTGNYIPARIGHRVFYGHIMETVDYNNKAGLADDFFSGKLDDEGAKKMLAEYGIRYVYLGPDERKEGGLIEDKPYLEERFSVGEVVIYEVKPQ